MRNLLIAALLLPLSGCVVSTIASTAVDLATLPVKVVTKSVDLATTSQAEADQNRGRAQRKADEKAGREAAARAKQRIADCKAATARGEACPPLPR
ncbi:MAG TPA: hypothetical protein VNI79_03990 [Sphingomicrobium sp.]|nr:hypothetical protein [Sphingomicrobium sp.]